MKEKISTSLLHKYKIQQLRTIPAEQSKSSKGSGGSAGPENFSATPSLPEAHDAKFKFGMELLKERIRNLPGREGIEFEKQPEPGRQEAARPVMSVKPLNVDTINIYKKKVDHLKYRRDDQSSLRIMEARRAVEKDEGKKKNLTATRIAIRARGRRDDSPLEQTGA